MDLSLGVEALRQLRVERNVKAAIDRQAELEKQRILAQAEADAKIAEAKAYGEKRAALEAAKEAEKQKKLLEIAEMKAKEDAKRAELALAHKLKMAEERERFHKHLMERVEVHKITMEDKLKSRTSKPIPINKEKALDIYRNRS